MTARAYQGVAVIILEFDVNFNKTKGAGRRARPGRDGARASCRRKPSRRPCRKSTPACFPVITVALSGDVPERTLLNLARDLSDEIKTIPSVLDVDYRGDAQGDAGDRHRSGEARKLRHHPAGNVQRHLQQQPADRGGLDRHRPWQLRRQGAGRHRQSRRTC